MFFFRNVRFGRIWGYVWGLLIFVRFDNRRSVVNITNVLIFFKLKFVARRLRLRLLRFSAV